MLSVSVPTTTSTSSIITEELELDTLRISDITVSPVLSSISLPLLQSSEAISDAHLSKVLLWKTVEEAEPLLLTSRKRLSSMSSWPPEVCSEEEFLNWVWLSLKELDGTPLTMHMLSLTSTEKAKDVHSLLVLPATLTNSAVQATEDALLLVEEVVHAIVTPSSVVDADTSVPSKNTTVTMKMVKIMLDFLTCKSMEEVLEANASLVL